MSSLPTDLDFVKDPSASPERMNRVMEYFLAQIRTLQAQRPEFDSAIALLEQVGLARVTESIGPIYLHAVEVQNALDGILANYDGFNPADFVKKTGNHTMGGVLTAAGLVINDQLLDALSPIGVQLAEAADQAAARSVIGAQAASAFLASIAAIALAGNAGKMLTVNGTGDGYALKTPGWQTIQQVTPTGTGIVQFDNIPTTFTALRIYFDGVSGNSGSSYNLMVAPSADGVTWPASGSEAFVASSMVAATTLTGYCELVGIRNNFVLSRSNSLIATPANNVANTAGTEGRYLHRCDGGVSSLRVMLSAGAFDLGSIRLSGI